MVCFILNGRNRITTPFYLWFIKFRCPRLSRAERKAKKTKKVKNRVTLKISYNNKQYPFSRHSWVSFTQDGVDFGKNSSAKMKIVNADKYRLLQKPKIVNSDKYSCLQIQKTQYSKSKQRRNGVTKPFAAKRAQKR